MLSHAACILRRTMATALPKYAAGTQPYTVLIEGNIGSGKTTFLNHFQSKEDFCLLTEPVEMWRDLKGDNLLELMYKQPDRWATPFQSYVTLTMLKNHIAQTDKQYKLMERSLYSARYCFIENMYRNKVIEKGMYTVLDQWYEFIEDVVNIRADLIVYLRTSPEVVYERMKKRARSEESCVPLKYLQELHELHENWLVHKRIGRDIQVLTLDANLDLECIGTEYKRSEHSIINDSLRQRPDALLVSPSKRQRVSS